MPQSLSLIILHIVFSTKNREPFIHPEIRPRLHAYLATLVRDLECDCYRVGGVADHVHIALRFSRTLEVGQLLNKIKSISSGWVKQQDPNLAAFAWQLGYGCFSVSPTHLDDLIHYIDTQDEHHQSQSFQDEMRMFYRKYGIDYDEKYVWD